MFWNKPESPTKPLFGNIVLAIVVVLLLVNDVVIDRFSEATHAAGMLSDIETAEHC